MTDIRARARTALHRLPRGRIALWIGASCLLLVSAGAMQVQWMSQANQARRVAAQEALGKSVRQAVKDLEFKAWLLLGMFRSDAELEVATPTKYFRQRLHMWHELSQHGPAIQRILIYDMGASDADSLVELTSFLKTGRFNRVPWEGDLVQVREYIEKHGFSYGRGVKSRWTATWMFHPGAMALFRPIVAHIPDPRPRPDWPAVTGYLIVKLDLTYIRDRLIPDTLNRRFDSGLLGHAYTIDIAVDGKCLMRYEPAGKGDAAETPLTPLAVSYSASRLDAPGALALSRAPDHSNALMLSQHDIPSAAVRKKGTVQRLRVHRFTDSWTLDTSPLFDNVERRSLWSTPWKRAVSGENLAVALRQQSGLPRLYLVGAKKHDMVMEARHVGLPLAEAINQEQSRPLAVSVIAFVLLLATTISVVVARGLVARSAELKTDAAASLAHQLLTPITAIVTLGENMARGVLGRGDKALEYGGLIHRYGQRLQTVVDRAMQMSAMDRFERRFDLVMLDVSKVAARALDDLSFVIEDAGFTAERALATDLPKVQADMEALQQAIADLIGNAVKYGSPGCWLKVETALAFAGSGQEVQIRVHDRGPGVPARDASRIFEPYYRIDNRISKSRPGAGLGLKLVVEMVKGMRGTVSLESEEGRGSVFTIHFPVPTA